MMFGSSAISDFFFYSNNFFIVSVDKQACIMQLWETGDCND